MSTFWIARRYAPYRRHICIVLCPVLTYSPDHHHLRMKYTTKSAKNLHDLKKSNTPQTILSTFQKVDILT